MAAGRRHLGGHGAAPRPGDLVDGIVSRVASGALFLDIGTGRDARLRLARGDELYSEGDELRGLRIAAADGEAGRTELRLPEDAPQRRDDGPSEWRRVGRGRGRGRSGPEPLWPQPGRRGRGSGRGAPRDSSPPGAPWGYGGGGGAPLVTAAWAGDGSGEDAGPPAEGRYDPGDLIDGVVLCIAACGIILDIGSGQLTGLLQVPGHLKRHFRVGDQVEGMAVMEVVPRMQQVRVRMDNHELTTAPPEPQTRSRQMGQPLGLEVLAPCPAAQEPGLSQRIRPGKLRLEELLVGDIADGLIVRPVQQGVLVDIGAERLGLLVCPDDMRKELRPHDFVQGMQVEAIDVARQQFTLTIDAPELYEVDVADKGRALHHHDAPERQPRQRAAARAAEAQPRPRRAEPQPQGGRHAAEPGGAPERWPRRERHTAELGAGLPLEDLRLGDLHDGVVAKITERGVLVDIGAQELGLLVLPSRELQAQFEVGDCVEGTVIDGLDLKMRRVVLSMDDPELEVFKPSIAGAERPPPEGRARQPRRADRGPARRPRR